MTRLTPFILLLAALGSAQSAKTTIEMSFDRGTGTYNSGEIVTLKCVVKTEEAQVLGYNQKWFKQQDGSYELVGEDANVLSAPFDDNPTKYYTAVEYDRKTMTSLFTLKISGVSPVDIGNYRCTAGYKGEESTESGILSLDIVPEPTDFHFRTDAPSDNSVSLFNIGHPVNCKGESSSLSDQLRIVIKKSDGTDVSQDFTKLDSLQWVGERGLKIPKSTHELQTNAWMPEEAGEDTLTCYYQDGDNQLIMQSFDYRRDEKAAINCSSNYKVPVKVENLDVYITCKLFNHNGDPDNVGVKWSFMFEDEKADLYTGETKHLRTASYVANNTYVLSIPIFTKEMARYGLIYKYNVTAFQKGSNENIASTSYGLEVDRAGPVAGRDGAPTLCYSIALLVILQLIQLHVV